MIAVGMNIVVGFLLATTFAALFHFLFGGPAGRIVLYVIVSSVGFALGHFLGRWLGLELLVLGSLYLLTASVGSWIMLFFTRWLWSGEATTHPT